MEPGPGEYVLRFVGDRLKFRLRTADGKPLPEGWRVLLRTNLGRGQVVRDEILYAHTGRLMLPHGAWHDIPMHWQDGAWERELTLTEPGYFKAKAYAVDAQGRQHWPPGPDVGISIHPDHARTANTIYCAFVRLFGSEEEMASGRFDQHEDLFVTLDKQGYTIIPPSGKLRDLIRHLPHIMDRLGCRILHLLPVTPTPTTYAKFGRYGSPYAVQHLTAIDPALVEFDKRTTGVDQFRELTYAVHCRGGRVFLDVVPNHTGWGARLQEEHPDWYHRKPDGEFVSPGAWGVIWEDLVELDHRNPRLWEHMAEAFLTWCRWGVDGFRCDAGYKIPVEAWRYITARVRDEFPETIFLLEGLGGSWEATEALLTEGGMQWAYSELFQNYTGKDVAWYLDYCLPQSERKGLYVHYSETHDNPRLAARGKAWSLLRNRLCALASISGGFGFTCGVEWLADEKINVHRRQRLRWGHSDNIVEELAQLNHLLADHPCFLDGARLRRLSGPEDPVLALSRESAEGLDRVLVLVNTDIEHGHKCAIDRRSFEEIGSPAFDLLSGAAFEVASAGEGSDKVEFSLAPGGAVCLATSPEPRDLRGETYRRARAQAAWAVRCLNHVLVSEQIGPFDWRKLAAWVEADPERFLASLSHLQAEEAEQDLVKALEQAAARAAADYPQVVVWELLDARRVTMVPPGHWLLIRDDARFRATLSDGRKPRHESSIAVGGRQIACFAPGLFTGDAELTLERFGPDRPSVKGSVRFLKEAPDISTLSISRLNGQAELEAGASPGVVLLTNGIGGMARLQVDFGRVTSKYDCALAANLHPAVPVDRHVFVKRLRLWSVADGFIGGLDWHALVEFHPGPPARWRFVASAGDGRATEIEVEAAMLPGRNVTVFRFTRPDRAPVFGRPLEPDRHVSLTVRADIEDRNFHWETLRNPEVERHFTEHCSTLQDRAGFAFQPAADRRLRVYSDAGVYHPEPEWTHCHHPLEASRGMTDHGDAYSPGWFELPLQPGDIVTLVLSAEADDPMPSELASAPASTAAVQREVIEQASLSDDDAFGRQLALAARAFVVRRDQHKTVIAGYPWFLDWGRDTFICARGLLAAGRVEEVDHLVREFARFEDRGTLPNTIHGSEALNRDTSDAPLWFGVVCEELAQACGVSWDGNDPWWQRPLEGTSRTLAEVLHSIATHYLRGTPNGIHTDRESGLVWSPTHFTWMDTNHPAGTPRQGYPVEIQVLWIRLLRLMRRLGLPPADDQPWEEWITRATQHFEKLFWLEEQGWLADVLLAERGVAATHAIPDTALRSNGLLAVSLGLLSGPRAQRVVQAAARYLVVPGAVRSLAPLRVSPPLPIHGPDGRLLNDPDEPYWGRYEGDEDTHRKPAYHNGTAWVWKLPVFCEALARAWDFSPAAVRAATAYLGSLDRLLVQGCRGQLPEILDGDAPHTQRGCDAQAWSITEALRVWKLLAARDRVPRHARSE